MPSRPHRAARQRRQRRPPFEDGVVLAQHQVIRHPDIVEAQFIRVPPTPLSSSHPAPRS
ncbi:MAG: hypothetical protein R2856_23870 [Caldilineaceae bacterium]